MSVARVHLVANSHGAVTNRSAFWSAFIVGVAYCFTPVSALAVGLIALLPLDASHANMDAATRDALEDSIRTVSGEAVVQFGFSVMAKDSTLQLLRDNNIDPEKVYESDCSLAAARELKAEYVIVGTVTSTEGEYVANLRLLEVDAGRQLGAMQFEGTAIRDLRRSFADKSKVFFQRMKDEVSRKSAPSGAKIASWVAVSAGAVAAIVGTIFAFEGKALLANDAVHTVDGVVAHAVTQARLDQSGAYYLTADILWGVGATAGVSGGIGLIVTIPRPTTSGSGGDARAWTLALSGTF